MGCLFGKPPPTSQAEVNLVEVLNPLPFNNVNDLQFLGTPHPSTLGFPHYLVLTTALNNILDTPVNQWHP